MKIKNIIHCESRSTIRLISVFFLLIKNNYGIKYYIGQLAFYKLVLCFNWDSEGDIQTINWDIRNCDLHRKILLHSFRFIFYLDVLIPPIQLAAIELSLTCP